MTYIGCESAGQKHELGNDADGSSLVGSRSEKQDNNLVPLNIFLQQLAASANAGVTSTAQPGTAPKKTAPKKTPKKAPKKTPKKAPKKAPPKSTCAAIEPTDNGSWVCDTNGFRFIYKNAGQSVHNTKCSLKCNDGFEATGFPNKNVRKNSSSHR